MAFEASILRVFQKFATKVAKISMEGWLSVDETAFVDKFKPHLMDNVYEWCSGASFADVCRRTHVYEGESDVRDLSGIAGISGALYVTTRRRRISGPFDFVASRLLYWTCRWRSELRSA